MGRPPYEFQTREQIADVANELLAIAGHVNSLLDSLTKIKAKGAKMVPLGSLAPGIEMLHDWLASGFARVSEVKSASESMGIPVPVDLITGYDREPSKLAGKNGKKTAKRSTSRDTTN